MTHEMELCSISSLVPTINVILNYFLAVEVVLLYWVRFSSLLLFFFWEGGVGEGEYSKTDV